MPYQTLQKKKRAVNPRAGERHGIDSELAQIAGLERVPSRDPVHHLIEHSRSMFDMLGRVNAEKMADPDKKEFDAVNEVLNEAGTQRKGKGEGNDGQQRSLGSELFGFFSLGKETESEASLDSQDGKSAGQSAGQAGGGFYKRFSEIAFNKGKLLVSVGEGGGKTMMASCIRQAIDQSPPTDARQTEVRKHGATQMRIPDSRASLSYHRYTRGALNLVVDTAQNLTRTLMVLERMAQGEVDDRLGLPGIDTAYRMYPFLNLKPDKEKLAAYHAEHRNLPDGEKKRAVEYGINRLNTIIAQKERMRVDFLFQLRKLMADSRRAEEYFSQGQIEDEIVKEIVIQAVDDDGDEKKKGKGRKK